jgi:hypothetical protein
MISLIVCGRRAAHVDHEYFSAHWRDVHGPLVLSVTEFTRHVRSYRQYHVQGGGDFDGVALLSFADADALTAAFSEPRFLSVLEPDTENFLDMANSQQIVAIAENLQGLPSQNPGAATLFEFAEPGVVPVLDAWAREPGKLKTIGVGHYSSVSPESPDTPPTIITACSFATAEEGETVMAALASQDSSHGGAKPLRLITREYVFV